MKASVVKAIIGGLIATLAMSVVMYMAPMMGMPEMNVAKMLSGMMHVPVMVGWMLHFIIGIIFSVIYARLFINWLQRIGNKILKGVIFGIVVFVFARIMMAVMGAIMPMPDIAGNVMLIMAGSIIGHIVYGIGVALIVTERKPAGSSKL